MDTAAIIRLLTSERDKLTRAIEALKGTPVERRGPPPKIEATTSQLPKKKRKFTAAHRKAAAERMKARWAAKKATKKPAK